MAIASGTILNTATTLRTAPAGGSAITSIILRNSDTSARTVTLHARVSGAAVAANNTFLIVSIPAGETYVFDSVLLLGSGDILSALADTTSVVYSTINYKDT